MRKTQSIHHKQENEHGLPRSIIAMDTGSVNRLCSPEQTATVGIGTLERRNRVIGSGRDLSNQCSARLRVAATRTNGVSALTRVVSGCRAEEWEKAARAGGVHMFCALAGMGVTLVEKRHASVTAGAGCHVAGQSLDDFGDQCRHQGVCDPGGLESASSRAGRVLAPVLGGTA